ncbi:mechanosensitive ion channel domain-containing protein [Phyllobacterium sp. OV277]|uniref:mechanosensitive ion channel domain-containing protein n=1 Tax=Phyllobacterium sp. OV277 TaxID=1882772 RepID=UPI00088DF32E|nr:mechanosensitive ion channel domain-containing protein [Phyllobacterium sp. OV277]SDN88557.1 Mechanosensitive ion channel [Phyllobacterium sp. OV277]
MEKEEADAIAALGTGALDVIFQTPLTGFLSLGALVLSFVIAKLITRRLKRIRPITSRIRIIIDYLSTIVLTILILFGLMRAFNGTLANPLIFVIGGILLSFLLVRIVGTIVELIFKPHDPLRSILRGSSVVFWLTVLIYLFGQWNETVKSFFDTEYSIGDAKISVLAILTILFFAAIIIIVTIWISEVSQRYLHKRSGLQPNLALALERIISVTIWIIAALIIISTAGINLTALAAFGGALGIGLGLGFQKLAASYISGLILLFERSVRVGDNLVSDRITGKVTEMTIRYTTIHTTDGLDVLISNDTLINSTIFNETLSNSNIRLEFPITVASTTDLDEARSIFLAAVQKQPRVMKEPPPQIYTASIENKSIKLLARFWINDPSNGRIAIISDINEMVLDEYKKKGIDLA